MVKGDQWEGVWRVLGACWPQAAQLQDPVVKIEWAAVFDGCAPPILMSAVRELARQSEWPSIASLTAAYDGLAARAEAQDRLKGLPAGPSAAWVVRTPESYEEAYLALDPAYREGVEERIKSRYPGAYAGRDEDPNLRWAWRCLVVAHEAGEGPLEASEDGAWRANVEATQRQLAHELSCPRCRVYAEPPGSPTKANLLRERRGKPCVVGELHWEPHYRAGMGRPVA